MCSQSGTNLEEYIYFNGARMARRDVSTNAVHYYFPDLQRSTRVVTNQTGSIPAEQDIDYYPYGGEIDVSNTVPQNYKYAGYLRDPETVFDYAISRYYDSRLSGQAGTNLTYWRWRLRHRKFRTRANRR